jgi:hypothetical protein
MHLIESMDLGVAPRLPPFHGGIRVWCIHILPRASEEKGEPAESDGWTRRHPAQVLRIVVLLMAAHFVAAQSPVPLEYRIKANLLAAFPSFIDWPGDAFQRPKRHSSFALSVTFDSGRTYRKLREARRHMAGA